MGIFKKALHSKIDVFVKFESAINLEIYRFCAMGIFKKALYSKIDVFVKFESAINLEIRGQI